MSIRSERFAPTVTSSLSLALGSVLFIASADSSGLLVSAIYPRVRHARMLLHLQLLVKSIGALIDTLIRNRLARRTQ